jgi:hypothetical protein
MSSLVFRDRQEDFAGPGGVPVLCSTLPGVVIGGLRIDDCLLWEGDPASCMYAMPTESGVWERSPGGMRIELSPKSTHGCPNTISSSSIFPQPSTLHKRSS